MTEPLEPVEPQRPAEPAGTRCPEYHPGSARADLNRPVHERYP